MRTFIVTNFIKVDIGKIFRFGKRWFIKRNSYSGDAGAFIMEFAPMEIVAFSKND
jgi:hypothetical protein